MNGSKIFKGTPPRPRKKRGGPELPEGTWDRRCFLQKRHLYGKLTYIWQTDGGGYSINFFPSCLGLSMTTLQALVSWAKMVLLNRLS